MYICELCVLCYMFGKCIYACVYMTEIKKKEKKLVKVLIK